MHTQKRRSQSLGGIHKSNSALQGRCAQTPCGDSHMHTQKRRSQSLGGIHKNICYLAGTMYTDTVWWQPDAHTEAKVAIAWCRPQMANQVGQPATFFWSSSTKR